LRSPWSPTDASTTPCLGQRKDAYESEKVSINYKGQSAWFKAERATNPYFARLNFSSAQATMRRLDQGFVAFFRRLKSGEKPGYPRFRGRDRYDSIEYPAYGDGIRLTGQVPPHPDHFCATTSRSVRCNLD
jgi:putative transposase